MKPNVTLQFCGLSISSELHCRLESLLTVTNTQRPEQLIYFQTAFNEVHKASPRSVTPKVVFTKGSLGNFFPSSACRYCQLLQLL